MCRYLYEFVIHISEIVNFWHAFGLVWVGSNEQELLLVERNRRETEVFLRVEEGSF